MISIAPAADVGAGRAHAGQLLPAGVAAGQRPALVADVVARGGGGEPEGPRFHGLAQQAPHGGDFVLRRRPLERGLAHDVVAQRRERHQAGHVDAEPAPVDGVEVLAVALPLPVDARLHDVVRNGLDVHEVLHEDLARLRLHRRHAHAAVAHDHGGHAVPRRAGQERVPGDLGVVVRVRIDEARRQDEAVGVDHPLRRLAVRLADGPDDAVLDPELPHEARRARAIADARVLDQQVEHEGSPFLVRLTASLVPASTRCRPQAWPVRAAWSRHYELASPRFGAASLSEMISRIPDGSWLRTLTEAPNSERIR